MEMRCILSEVTSRPGLPENQEFPRCGTFSFETGVVLGKWGPVSHPILCARSHLLKRKELWYALLEFVHLMMCQGNFN